MQAPAFGLREDLAEPAFELVRSAKGATVGIVSCRQKAFRLEAEGGAVADQDGGALEAQVALSHQAEEGVSDPGGEHVGSPKVGDGDELALKAQDDPDMALLELVDLGFGDRGDDTELDQAADMVLRGVDG